MGIFWPSKNHTASTHEKPKQVIPLTKEQRYELRQAMDGIKECDEVLASLVQKVAERKAEARDLFWIAVSGISGVARYDAIQVVNYVACQIEIYDYDVNDPALSPTSTK